MKYAALGIPVLPLWWVTEEGHCACPMGARCNQKPGKHPIGKLAPRGKDSATLSDSQIRIWWTQFPKANIAGRMNGPVIAIDADADKGGLESIQWLQDAYGEFPHCPVQQTGGGGKHFYFKRPSAHVVGTVDAFRDQGYPGIDIRSNDNYTVLEPSNHLSGRLYQFEVDSGFEDFEEFPELPHWLLALLELKVEQDLMEPGERSGIPIGKSTEEFLSGRVPRGSQRARACAAARNLQGGGYKIEDAIEMIWRGLDLSDQDPESPWKREHAVQLVRSIYGSRAPRAKPLKDPSARVTAKKSAASASIAAQAPALSVVPGGAAAREPEPDTDAIPPWSGDDEEAEWFPLTDVGNAERLVAAYGEKIRYCAAWKQWLIWDGKRWKPDETDGAPIYQMAKDVVRKMYIEAGNTRKQAVREALAGWARKSEAAQRIKAMITLAQGETNAGRQVGIAASELDNDIWFFNVKNGTIDLRTGELRPHDPKDLITKLVDIEYDPAAKCERWMLFLAEIMEGSKPLMRYLWKAFGWSMTGDVRTEAFIFCYGTGANGKSKFLDVLLALLGPYAVGIQTECLMVQYGDKASYDEASLKGARVAIAEEAPSGKKFDEGKIKRITGGNAITARHPYGRPFTFMPTHTLWLTGNHKPTIDSTTLGMWRRVHLVPFMAEFPPGDPRRDEQLLPKLIKELPGILAWSVKGAMAFVKEGLEPPEEIRAAVAEYREEMDILGAFLKDCTEPDEFGRLKTEELHQAYVRWSKGRNETPMSITKFGTQLKDRGLRFVTPSGYKFWTGYSLVAAYDQQATFRGSFDD